MPEAACVTRPDFYIAAIGRSGSTMLCNWLTRLPDQLVFNEPFFSRRENSRLLKIQLASFGMPATCEEWEKRDEPADQRFERLMGRRLDGRRWAFKEVLCEEHERALERFAPPKVVICVRNIVDVALSFFEKHRTQANLARFSDEWVVDYCAQETDGIVRFQELLETCGVPYRVVRYEEFVRSDEARTSLERFLGWTGGGETATNFDQFDRWFEVARHGPGVSGAIHQREHRGLTSEKLALAASVGERCSAYQLHFGYDVVAADLSIHHVSN
jgi:hypothetical protein